MLIAAVGIAIGLVVGAALPFLVTALFGSVLPIPIAPTLAPGELGLALLYGALTALAFAIAPLGRAHDVPVSGLFRDQIEPERRWPRRRYLAIARGLGRALIGLAFVAAYDRRIALIFIGRGGARLRAAAARRDRHHGARPPPAAAAPRRRRAWRSPTSTARAR